MANGITRLQVAKITDKNLRGRALVEALEHEQTAESDATPYAKRRKE